MKWSYRAGARRGRPAAIARAYNIAMQQPCGPTFVSIPVDDWERSCEAVPARTRQPRAAPDPALLDTIGDRARSLRAAGVRGRRQASIANGAWEAVVALAERHQALVWVSPMSSRVQLP